MSNLQLNSIEEAIAALRQGQMVILLDDEKRENEGDLVIAAEHITPAAINFMTQYARGLVCMPMLAEDFARLQIPMMIEQNRSRLQTAFGVSFGAAQGMSSGISTADRAHTVKTAIDPNSGPEAIVMPGHVFPLKAHSLGVIGRPGHTEGSTDLVRLAGLKPAAVICEVMNPDGTMARLPELLEFAATHNLCVVTIQDLINYRFRHENLVQLESSARLPTKHFGDFRIEIFRSQYEDRESIALIKDPIDFNAPVLVRLHSECITGELFESLRCDCGEQLNKALDEIATQGGVLLYLRQEGRGIGLVNKIKSYALQEQGLDTVEANHHLGFAADQRNYGLGAQILRLLGICQVRLLTNNPNKVKQLENYGINVVERVSLQIQSNAKNQRYLRTKRDKLGHFLTMMEG